MIFIIFLKLLLINISYELFRKVTKNTHRKSFSVNLYYLKKARIIKSEPNFLT